MHTILVVEDERAIRRMLVDYFTMNDYHVISAADGEAAMDKLNEKIDLVLMDVGLPGIDGFEVVKRVRTQISCPIVFLTARIEDEDKLNGFALGGDDYVVKPFNLDILGARIAAHLRRENRQETRTQMRFDSDLCIRYADKTVMAFDEPIPLAKKEFEILEFLSMHPGRVFDKERIYEKLWGYDGEGDSAVIAEHIRRIRAKLTAAGCKAHIETIWGMGYKWVR